MLLDLLGAANPTIPSYFLTTHWAYASLAALETRLRDLALFTSSPNHPSSPAAAQHVRKAAHEPTWFPDTKPPYRGQRGLFSVDDDHRPFLDRGVEVLHLIPNPFPVAVWHRIEDDGEHLDAATVVDWGRLMAGWVGGWLELEGWFVDPTEERGDDRREVRRREWRGERGIGSKTEL